MGKERAYSAKPSITSGDQCRAPLPGLALLLSMGAGEANGGRKPPASCPSLRPNVTKAIGPNPVPTIRYHQDIFLPLKDRYSEKYTLTLDTALDWSIPVQSSPVLVQQNWGLVRSRSKISSDWTGLDLDGPGPDWSIAGLVESLPLGLPLCHRRRSSFRDSFSAIRGRSV